MQNTMPISPELLSADGQRRTAWSLLPAVTLPFLGSFIYFVILAGRASAPMVYGGVKVFTLFYPLLVIFVCERAAWRLPALAAAKHRRSLPLGMITGLAMIVAMAAVFAFTPIGEMLLANRAQIRAKVEGLGVLNVYVPFACFIVFCHSLLEEYYWRWFVFGRLRQVLPGFRGHLAAGFAFALHHYVILFQYMPGGYALFLGTFVGIGGMIWSWQYVRQGSLVGSWVSHAVVDALIFTIGYFIIF